MAIKKMVKKIAAAGKKTDAAERPAKTIKPGLTIDHPAEGETVWSGHYAVRISAPAQAEVEVRVDGGPWKPCRSAAGHWWLDLSGLADGGHELVARLKGSAAAAAAPRKFKVSGV